MNEGSESIDAKRQRCIYFVAVGTQNVYFSSERAATRYAQELDSAWDLYQVDLYGPYDRCRMLVRALNGDSNVGTPELLYGSEG